MDLVAISGTLYVHRPWLSYRILSTADFSQFKIASSGPNELLQHSVTRHLCLEWKAVGQQRGSDNERQVYQNPPDTTEPLFSRKERASCAGEFTRMREAFRESLYAARHVPARTADSRGFLIWRTVSASSQ
ncbi:hypothetical protein EW145_g3650 [Phellinidium pouzarii]|uniref:Uncharacterized protein n=1 Tax=Phellinidium pouzarii TaxID=167371 RepID=A0A4S4LBM2_9AGAM|nr:hypothetical protein EW145_g3650 [Phellinidium pouzarii]